MCEHDRDGRLFLGKQPNKVDLVFLPIIVFDWDDEMWETIDILLSRPPRYDKRRPGTALETKVLPIKFLFPVRFSLLHPLICDTEPLVRLEVLVRFWAQLGQP